LLAASSASSAYVQYACGASSLPPRYPLKAKWYNIFTLTNHCFEFIFLSGNTTSHLNGKSEKCLNN